MAITTSFWLPGMERGSRTDWGSLKWTLNRPSFIVPSGRIVHSAWGHCQNRS